MASELPPPPLQTTNHLVFASLCQETRMASELPPPPLQTTNHPNKRSLRSINLTYASAPFTRRVLVATRFEPVTRWPQVHGHNHKVDIDVNK
ncbi:hypothetical protein TNCV_3855171 [Trichonephila clavipes]|nr:hypothetical protein TNCV_3855171 [Trichonephila clavipes]